MIKTTENEATSLSQDVILQRLIWFRNMSEFYRQAVDYCEFSEQEINAFETEKITFLKLHNLENTY